MADAGSREIRALLTSADGNLDANLQALGEALPEDDAEATTPASAFEALRNVRRSYQRLGRRVRAIKTSCGAKRDVLDALRALDAAPEALCEGAARTRHRHRSAAHRRRRRGRTQDAATALADATKALA